jgi:hypothetical protein
MGCGASREAGGEGSLGNDSLLVGPTKKSAVRFGDLPAGDPVKAPKPKDLTPEERLVALAAGFQVQAPCGLPPPVHL